MYLLRMGDLTLQMLIHQRVRVASLSQWTLKKKFELYFPYQIWNLQKFKRLAIG